MESSEIRLRAYAAEAVELSKIMLSMALSPVVEKICQELIRRGENALSGKENDSEESVQDNE